MPDVKIFALTTCIHCKNAMKYLDENDVKYEACYVDTYQGDEKKEILAEVKKHNPSTSFPTLLIGDLVVVGFQKDAIKRALRL